LLKKGRSNKEIAQELHIEVSTVKSHLNKIYSRLGVKSRKEIVNTEW
jgi:DNA-binding NarL/FixJ family response regulator